MRLAMESSRAMTVVVAVNSLDSIVLASDSATTQWVQVQGGQREPNNIWNSASKIFNLRKAWPVAAVTWGQAAIDGQSIATLAKELRCRFSGQRQDHLDWALDLDNYTIQQVAERTRDFFYNELGQHDATAPDGLGLAVAGYSAGSNSAEMFEIKCCNNPPQPTLSTAGVWWAGQLEVINRLVKGVSSRLGAALAQLAQPPEHEPDAIAGFVQQIETITSVPVVSPGMPIGEAIELAEFLVDVSIKFVRFTPGHQTVGGPIDIAALTRHEGYKWIKRKLHYPQALNLEGELA
jgi:hypothetical protein